jgi:hypothetical protein
MASFNLNHLSKSSLSKYSHLGSEWGQDIKQQLRGNSVWPYDPYTLSPFFLYKKEVSIISL